jgi:serine/threonine protein kinase
MTAEIPHKVQSPCIPGYTIERVISETSNSVVYRGCEQATGAPVAIKISDAALLQEAEILSGIHHKGILSPLAVIRLDDGRYALITPFGEGGDLFDCIQASPLSEENAKKVFITIASATAELHKHQIWHRDIKLENIVLMKPGDFNSAVLMDFGLAKRFPQGVSYGNWAGSVHYAAPEVLDHRPYTAAIDVWSLGVTIFAAVTGRFPSGGPTFFDDVMAGFPHLKYDQGFQEMSYELQDLLQQMLDPEPYRRITMRGVCNHPWFFAVNKQRRECEEIPWPA